jgi:hypothetical protein
MEKINSNSYIIRVSLESAMICNAKAKFVVLLHRKLLGYPYISIDGRSY